MQYVVVREGPLEVRIGGATVTLAQVEQFIADLTQHVDAGLHIAASGPLMPVNRAMTVADVETLDAVAFAFSHDLLGDVFCVDRQEIDLARDEGDLDKLRRSSCAAVRY